MRFYEEFLAVRDGGMTPQDSWRWRHDHTLTGLTFYVGVPNLETFSFSDLKFLLLEAAKTEMVTDVQLHFNSADFSTFRDVMKPHVETLIEEGFLPVSMQVKNENGVQWMRLALFTKQCLPETLHQKANA